MFVGLFSEVKASQLFLLPPKPLICQENGSVYL